MVDLNSVPEDVARKLDSDVVFLPHPNLASALDHAWLETSDVTIGSYQSPDVQSFFSRASLLITDISSISFNLAYLGVPTVYFQDEASEKSHTSYPGYFDYERDGFGPVTTSAEELLSVFDSIRSNGISALDRYADRRDIFVKFDRPISEELFSAMDIALTPLAPKYVYEPNPRKVRLRITKRKMAPTLEKREAGSAAN